MLTDIASHLTSEFADSWTGCPIQYDNAPDEDYSDGPLWGRLSVNFGDQKVRSFGSPKRTDQNLRLTLKLSLRRGDGSGDIFDAAQEYIEIFRYYRYQETSFSIAGYEPSMMKYDDDPDWFQVTVSIFMVASF